MTPGQALIAVVRAELDERWPFRDIHPADIPPGLRLELHPAAWNEILTDHEIWTYGRHEHSTPGGSTRDLAEMPGLPAVKLDPELDYGCWRLVIITEEVLNGGNLVRKPKTRSETVHLPGDGPR